MIDIKVCGVLMLSFFMYIQSSESHFSTQPFQTPAFPAYPALVSLLTNNTYS